MTLLNMISFSPPAPSKCFFLAASLIVRDVHESKLRLLIARQLKVSVHLIENWRHFVSPKTLLRFWEREKVRVRAGVSVNSFSIKRVFEQV